jgi:hypothetical protein
VAQIVGGARRQRPEVHAREHDLLGTREAEEVGDHLPERLGLLANAFDIRLVGRGQRRRIDEPAITVDRRQAVAKFMRDAGGQLADPREAVLQPQLLFQLDDVRKVGEEADDALERVARARIGSIAWTVGVGAARER